MKARVDARGQALDGSWLLARRGREVRSGGDFSAWPMCGVLQGSWAKELRLVPPSHVPSRGPECLSPG